MWILMRPTGPSVSPQVRTVIRQIDPNLPVVQAGTLADMTAFTLFPHRLAAWLAVIVGTMGVFLGALGIYGITAYNVTQRAREIGIRVALGAPRAQVLRLMLGHAITLIAVGTALGLAAAALVTRLLEGMLYGVRALDPISFSGGAVVFVGFALIAESHPSHSRGVGKPGRSPEGAVEDPPPPESWGLILQQHDDKRRSAMDAC